MATTLSGPPARGGTPSMQRATSQVGMAHPTAAEMAPPQRPPQPVSYQSDVNFSSSTERGLGGSVGVVAPPPQQQSQMVMQRVPPEPAKDLVQGYTVPGYAAPVQANPPPTLVNTDQLEFVADGEDEYEDILVTLKKGNQGLGFSIAGGSDYPHIGNDPHIYITKIIPDGIAEQDGTLRVNDILLSVNDVSCENVTHSQAVEILKSTPNVVRMVVRRIRLAAAEKLIEIELLKGDRGLGFSIAGGIGNNHVPGDCGIFVTKLIPGGAAEAEGQLQVGDRIIAVRSWDRANPQETMFDTNLEHVYHEEAVATLKKTLECVILVVAKPAKIPLDTILPENYCSAPGSMPQGSPIKTQRPPEDDFDRQQSYNMPPEGMERVSSSVGGALNTSMSMYSPTDMSSHRGAPGGGHQVLHSEISPAGSNMGAPMSHPPSDNESQVRFVKLHRGPTGLGFNIVGGEDGEGLFVSFILPGGVADLSGQLQKGDQILAVNQVNLTYATHEQAAQTLKSAGQTVTLEVVHKPDEYARFEAKINELREQMISNAGTGSLKTSAKKSFFVRALFDYVSEKDSAIPGQGLSFNHGDILHVRNASDEEWWAASLVTGTLDAQGNVNEEGIGIIPSKRRIERRERQRIKSVKFSHGQEAGDRRSNTLEKKKRSGLLKKFTLSKSKDSDLDNAGTMAGAGGAAGGSGGLGPAGTASDIDQSGQYTSNASDSEGSLKGLDGEPVTIMSYELVMQIEINYKRPIVILGPWKDSVNDDLISQHQDLFGSCVPHTTRPKREYEKDGRDYHFVESREEMERDIQAGKFIEAGQYNDNLYGTSLKAVEDVCVHKGKHCILDVSGNAIKRLMNAQIYPVAVFIRPRSVENIMDTLKRIPENQASKMFQRAQKTEVDFGESFIAIVEGDTYEEIYEKVRRVISLNSGPHIWIASKDKL